jgi:hypothetical protein
LSRVLKKTGATRARVFRGPAGGDDGTSARAMRGTARSRPKPRRFRMQVFHGPRVYPLRDDGLAGVPAMSIKILLMLALLGPIMLLAAGYGMSSDRRDADKQRKS